RWQAAWGPPIGSCDTSRSSVVLLRRLSRASLDERDLIAGGVETHFIHESSYQKQTAAADVVEMGRVGRVGELGSIEAGSLIADAKEGSLVGKSSVNVEPSLAIRELLAALDEKELVSHAVIDGAQVRAELQVAVLDRVDEGLV